MGTFGGGHMSWLRSALGRIAAVPRPAVIALLAYLALAAGLGGQLPFVQWSMFRFHLPTGSTAMPLFRADGERAQAESYTDFVGLPPSVVDVKHIGHESGVEHKFHDLALWLKQHQAAPDAGQQPVQIEIGLTILRFDAQGKVLTEARIDATGSARQAKP